MTAIKLNAPNWIKELASPQELFMDSLLSVVLTKVHEYKNEEEYYENKYQIEFESFEKKLKSLKKEDFKKYDDYILWKGAHFLYKKWLQRYNNLTVGKS